MMLHTLILTYFLWSSKKSTYSVVELIFCNFFLITIYLYSYLDQDTFYDTQYLMSMGQANFLLKQFCSIVTTFWVLSGQYVLYVDRRLLKNKSGLKAAIIFNYFGFCAALYIYALFWNNPKFQELVKFEASLCFLIIGTFLFRKFLVENDKKNERLKKQLNLTDPKSKLDPAERENKNFILSTYLLQQAQLVQF
jgi:hypothetical protein